MPAHTARRTGQRRAACTHAQHATRVGGDGGAGGARRVCRLCRWRRRSCGPCYDEETHPHIAMHDTRAARRSSATIIMARRARSEVLPTDPPARVAACAWADAAIVFVVEEDPETELVAHLTCVLARPDVGVDVETLAVKRRDKRA